MAVRVVRLGTPKGRDEGVRLGTVRLLPRGIRKQDYARLNYFDVWLPEVAPSRGLVSYARAKPWTDARWAAYTRRYLGEMRRPEARRLIALLAALSKQADFSIGCYCESPSRCHRSLLAELLREQGGKVSPRSRYL
jgi:uncharacterized protein YeaO (DUF488 family)